MSELFGFSRTVVKERYALITPEGFVTGNVPGWKNCVAVVNISPALGARFAQLQITLNEKSSGEGNTARIENFVYVIHGKCAAKLAGKKYGLTSGSFVFIPSGTDFQFSEAARETRLLIFQKEFQPLVGQKKPDMVVGHAKDVAGKPFLGNDDARLQVLLPDNAEFDLAVNIFTYQPGATLPFVETHVMEHGLVMLTGQGVYRLDADHHPVRSGDVIWMGPHCPQWFVAMGKTPASYIYYKNVNRAPLGE